MNRNSKGQFIKGHRHSEEMKRKLSKLKVGRKLSVGHRRNLQKAILKQWAKGKRPRHWKLSKEQIKAMTIRFSEEKGGNWKGDKVGYRALHNWVHKKLGKPQKCEFCGKEKTTPKSIHWANLSRKYLREISDWISLCAKCHKQYDHA